MLRPQSNLYYLLPAFLSIIGGLIAAILLRKAGRQYDKKGRNCVILGIISSGFAIGMDYVNDTTNIPMIEDYINTNGMLDILGWFGGTSIYVFPPIVIAYCILAKIINH
ncbi:MAG TPA: hypothetical protein QF456_00230 [Nitrosopumilus sp.]|jgi:hypothetical protein|nr:hypothetical protein [Nitrosopumilus sp.]HJM79668.1 hypothetical protein [Nitrosopumilus sp.]